MCGEEECPGSTARHSGALGDARAMVEGGVPRSLGKGDGIGDSALGTGDGGDAVGRVRVEVVPERGDGGHQRTAQCPSERSSVGFESGAGCSQSAQPQLRAAARGVAPTSVQQPPEKPKRVLTLEQKKAKRENMRRSRESRHYGKQGDLEQPREACWVESIAKDPHEKSTEIKRLTHTHWSRGCDFNEGKVREQDLKIVRGWIKSSVPKTVPLYNVRGSSLVGAMIAARAGEGRKFWRAIEHGRLFLDEPAPKKVKEEMVHQLTLGSSLSRKHSPCVLVKKSNGEWAWVRESEVGPVEQDGKRRTAPPDRYKPGDRSMAPSVPQLRSRGGILDAVEPPDMVMLYYQVKKSVWADLVFVDPQSRTEQVVHQF